MYDYKNIEENEIFNCIKLNKDKCKTSSICRVTNDKCTLILPKKNLVTNTDNEIYYYGRMADELIRYNRIKSFMFKPQAYLSFGQVKYNLRDNEIIILQDLLYPEFFENFEGQGQEFQGHCESQRSGKVRPPPPPPPKRSQETQLSLS